MKHELAGFGFGPVQAGLFAAEARKSGAFARIGIAEIDAELVEAVRKNGSRYSLNVAHAGGIEAVDVEGVELFNSAIPAHCRDFISLLESATEIVTALPSAALYREGGRGAAASLIARGLAGGRAERTLVYAAENNNAAAELLEKEVRARLRPGETMRPCRFLNTVIGKMSQLSTDAEFIRKMNLKPLTPGSGRAFLVEEFNRIFVSAPGPGGFQSGFRGFDEKEDLVPFEEAKLYGHNAVHTMLGFLGRARGLATMDELKGHPDLMETARRAFVDEIGRAFVRRYGDTGELLFTEEGFGAYAGDLLERITSPMLCDAVERVVRDPLRKLGPEDRIFGSMRFCLGQGVAPRHLAAGARAGLDYLLKARSAAPWRRRAGIGEPAPGGEEMTPDAAARLLGRLWGGFGCPPGELETVVELLFFTGEKNG